MLTYLQHVGKPARITSMVWKRADKWFPVPQKKFWKPRVTGRTCCSPFQHQALGRAMQTSSTIEICHMWFRGRLMLMLYSCNELYCNGSHEAKLT